MNTAFFIFCFLCIVIKLINGRATYFECDNIDESDPIEINRRRFNRYGLQGTGDELDDYTEPWISSNVQVSKNDYEIEEDRKREHLNWLQYREKTWKPFDWDLPKPSTEKPLNLNTTCLTNDIWEPRPARNEPWNRNAFKTIEAESGNVTSGCVVSNELGSFFQLPRESVVCYTGVDFGSDYATQIEMRFNSWNIRDLLGDISFSMDSPNNDPFATIPIKNILKTNELYSVKELFNDPVTGVHDLYVTPYSTRNKQVYIDWFKFYK